MTGAGTDEPQEATIEVRPAAAPGSLLPVVPVAPSQRYSLREELGRGAMGEVVVAQDEVLRREVALKRLRSDRARPGSQGRFVQEAMIQARLGHPAIVPVHDVGVWNDEPFFTMRAVRGPTLAEYLSDCDESDDTIHQLLGVLERVCLAVDYAHSKGVIHRDLKPSNIMLGEFGEVYVLDWGVARELGAPASPGSEAATGDDSYDATQNGTVVGSPAYMSPEQLEGRNEGVGPRSDVYALGAIAFEALAGERFHPRGVKRQPGEVVDVAAEVQGRGGRLPPELADVLVRALQQDVDERLPQARDLADALRRYAAGDRDRKRREESSAEGIARARTLLARDDDDARTEAMREIGRALALDPDNGDALEVLVEVLNTPPRQAPPEVEAALEETMAAGMRTMAPAAMRSYAGVLPFLPLALWMGFEDMSLLWVMLLAIPLAIAAVALGRKFGGGRGSLVPSILVATVFCGFTAGAFGPFVVTPLIVLVAFMFFVMHLGAKYLWPLFGLASASMLIPAALMGLGVLPASYQFVDGSLIVAPRFLSYPPLPTTLMLAGSSIVAVGIGLSALARFRNALLDAERRAQMHAYQISRLLPAAGRRG